MGKQKKLCNVFCVFISIYRDLYIWLLKRKEIFIYKDIVCFHF